MTTASPARTYELRVDLADFENETRYAEYSSFTIAPEAENYRLDLGAYTGDAGLLFLDRLETGPQALRTLFFLFLYLFLYERNAENTRFQS